MIGWRYEFARFHRRRGGEPWTAREFANTYGWLPGESPAFLGGQVGRGILVVVENEPKRYAPVLDQTVCAVVRLGPR